MGVVIGRSGNDIENGLCAKEVVSTTYMRFLFSRNVYILYHKLARVSFDCAIGRTRTADIPLGFVYIFCRNRSEETIFYALDAITIETRVFSVVGGTPPVLRPTPS